MTSVASLSLAEELQEEQEQLDDVQVDVDGLSWSVRPLASSVREDKSLTKELSLNPLSGATSSQSNVISADIPNVFDCISPAHDLTLPGHDQSMSGRPLHLFPLIFEFGSRIATRVKWMYVVNHGRQPYKESH